MDRPPSAATADGRRHRRRSCLHMLRRAFVSSLLALLLAAQLFGAIHLRGLPGMELLTAAITPGAALLCLLQWAAGPRRLKWPVAFEQVALGAIFSVLLAVGLELASLLVFGAELRNCSPPSDPSRAPIAAAGSGVLADRPLVVPLEEADPTVSSDPSFVGGLLEPQPAGCGSIGSRGVASHFLWLVGSQTKAAESGLSFGQVYASLQPNPLLCIAFIFFYMMACIGYAEELSKAAALLLLRPSEVPSGATAVNGTSALFALRAAKEADSCCHYVPHPISVVVAGCSAALGFATVENLSYVFATKSDMDTALITAWVRAFTAIPSHAANTGIAACFLATVAARSLAAAAVPPTDGAALAALENGDGGQLETGGRRVQVVGEAHPVMDSSAGADSMETLAVSLEVPKTSFFWPSLLQCAVLPGLLHGWYDAALTLASSAYSQDGSGLTASGWLILALVAWCVSIVTFCTRWFTVSRLEDFYVYFSGVPPYRPNLVVPFPARPARPPPLQSYSVQQQHLLLQQQLLQQQLLQQQFVPIPAEPYAGRPEPLSWQPQQQQPGALLSDPVYRHYAPMLSSPGQSSQSAAAEQI